MVELVEVLAKNLVDDPEQIKITEEEENGVIYIQLSVAPEDMGKVIGRQGKIAKAMRTILKAAAILNHKRVDLKIV